MQTKSLTAFVTKKIYVYYQWWCCLCREASMVYLCSDNWILVRLHNKAQKDLHRQGIMTRRYLRYHLLLILCICPPHTTPLAEVDVASHVRKNVSQTSHYWQNKQLWVYLPAVKTIIWYLCFLHRKNIVSTLVRIFKLILSSLHNHSLTSPWHMKYVRVRFALKKLFHEIMPVVKMISAGEHFRIPAEYLDI